ncbi:hypothetical protein ABT090_20895 [Streptomyces asoensis]|uniref:hypothetical protein n=1 Tax=Streptomyces asoensis TaxID=249586 RepID=UPI00331A0892
MTRTRAPKPNQHERAQRRTTIETILGRALRGVLTIPEAAVLADYVRADWRLADKTRQSLGATTRALAAHRAAADAAVLEAEQRAERAEANLREAAAWIRRNYPGLKSVNDRLTAVLDDPPPVHDAVPSVAECAANDRRWPLDKAGE